MKKIITAAAIAAMAAGFATAETNVSVYYRTGMDIVQHEINDNTGDSHGSSFFSNNSERSTAGEIAFKGSGDYGGVEFAGDAKTGDLNLTKYNGWINFGNFMLKSGAWDKRAVGRVNGSAGPVDTWFGEITKPGLGTKISTAGNGSDISQQSGKKQTTMLQYANKDLGLEARLAFRDTDGTTTTYDDTNEVRSDDRDTDFVLNNDLWFAELGYNVKDVGHILLTGKFQRRDTAGAIFFEPKLANAKALTSLIGFTVEQNRHAKKDADGDYRTANDYAIDFRARYDLKDAGVPLAITFMYNWTFGNQLTAGDDHEPGIYASWGLLNFRYTLNENVIPFFSTIYTSGNAWSHASSGNYYKPAVSTLRFDDPFNFSLRLVGGVELYNTKNAVVLVAVVYDASNMMERDTFKWKADGNNEAGYHAAGVKAVHIPLAMKISL